MVTSGKLVNPPQDPPSRAAGASQESARETADPSTVHLSDHLRVAVGKLWRRIRNERSAGELTELQYSVLALLVREGPRTFSRIAGFVHVTPPSITRTADRLAELGLAERTADMQDGRVSLLAPTPSGTQFVEDVRRMRSEWLCSALAQLPQEDRVALAQAAPILRRLAESRVGTVQDTNGEQTSTTGGGADR